MFKISILRTHVRRIFPITVSAHNLFSLGSLDVLDLYIDKKNRVWIIDFDGFGPSHPVDPLLFSWQELENQSSENEIPFLVVTHDGDRLPYDLGASRGPVDLVEVPNAVQLMMSLANRKTFKNAETSESSDEEEPLSST
jgi:hypothetical protein